MFKPFQVSHTAQQEIRSNRSEFLEAVRDQLSRMGPSSSTPIVPDTPQHDSQTINQQVSLLDKVSESDFDKEAFQEQSPQIAKLHWQNN